jgi:hypothetical protein
MNCNYRIAVTLYCLGTWFVSNICVDTLRKLDDNDNDNDDDDNDDDNNIITVRYWRLYS